MEKVLIVGVSGILGKQIFQSFKSIYNLSGVARKDDFKENYFISLDLVQSEKVDFFVKKSKVYDCIIFLVGLAHKKGRNSDYDEFYNTNFLTLKNLLSCLEKENKLPPKIIFASTISVYGEKMKTSLYHENSVKTPFSPYAITKRKAEKYLQKNYPNQSYILRLAPVYSSNFTLNIKRRTKLLSFYYKVGNGGQKLSLCNISNILVVIEAIIDEKIPAGVYNIADNCEYHYTDLLEHINAKSKITIPSVFIWILYYFGRSIGNNYLRENSIKLLSNNIYSIEKIKKYIDLKNTLYSEKF